MRVLFTGYAPIHSICFAPIREELKAEGHDVWTIPESGMLALPNFECDLWFVAHTNAKPPRSYGKCIQIFHGCSFRNVALRPKAVGKDAYFAWGPRMHEGLRALGVPTEQIHNVGAPKTDKLLDDIFYPTDLAFENMELPLILYAPTGAKDNSLETGLGLEVVNELCMKGTYNVAVKLHDHPKRDQMRILASLVRGHPNFHVSNELDVTKLMKRASLLLTDASSVANEFCLLNRPIVFLDVPKLLKRAAKSPQYDPKGRNVGFTAKDPQHAVGMIDAYLELPLMTSFQRRDRELRTFYNAGHATEAAMEAIKELT